MPVAKIGESVSYSDKLREQANLINQRRQQNLNAELAQEDRNRAFREKQIADTYSFDTTGINPAFLPTISDLQAKISGHLDPNSGEVYESKEDLIKDTNTLKSIYNVAKSNTEIGQASAGTYRGYLDGSVTLPDGQAFAGNKEVYDARYRAYEKGGLDDIQIEGSAGNYTITGFELIESDLGDGSFVPSGERVNVLSSVSAIDPSYLFRPEVVKDSYLIPADNYLKFNSVEQALSQASRDFDPKAASIQQPYRASLAEDQPEGGWLDVAENDVTDGSGKVTTKKGDYLRGQSELKESYLKEIEDFWNDNYQVDMSSSRIGSGSVSVEVNGTSVNAYQILDPKTKKPVKPEVSLQNAGSVKVSYVNASGEGDDTVLTMVYEIDGELQSETVGVSTGAARSLMDQIGGESGLVDLISRQTDLKGTSSVNKGTVKEGGKGGKGGEKGEEDAVKESEEEAKVSETLESQVADLDFEIQQLESSLSSTPKANQDLETISKLQEKKKEKEEIEERLGVISSNDSGFSSNEEFDSYLKQVKEGDRWFRSSTPSEKLAKKIDGLTPTEQNKAIQEELDVFKNNFNDLSNKQSTPSVKIKMDENIKHTEELEKMSDALGYTEKASAIQNLDKDPIINPKGIVNVNLEPIKDRAPKAASVIEASIDSGEAIEVSVDAPIEEKREATKQTLLGIVKPGVLESEMEETIAELISGVVGPAVKDSLFESQRAQIDAGETTDPVPPWCAYWCADMIMRADSDFDLSSVRTKGGTEKDDPYNLGRAEKYLAIGEGVSKSDGRYDARIGDVVVKMRKTSKGSQYHVGFFAGYDENGNVLILGGNQQDSLNITPYPYEQVQDIRRINVNAVSAEDIEAMSDDINVDGKTT